MATTAKIFKSGNSQAVRLPKEFRIDAKEVEIFRRGEEIVLREKKRSMKRALEIIMNLPDDMIEALEKMDDPPPQKRKGL